MFRVHLARLRWASFGAAGAALILVATTALAGSGVGGVFNLGQANSVDAQSTLTGNPGGTPQLKLVNGGTGAALRAESQTGIGVNGISVSGTGQLGQSDAGTGLLGLHTDTAGTEPGIEGRTSSTDPSSAGVIGRNTGGGPGLRAIVSAGAPPLDVNSQVKVANLNADKLDDLDSSALQRRVTGACNSGQAIRVVNADGSVSCEPVGINGAWGLNGNGSTNSGNFVGTTDNKALELRVNGKRALRLEPSATSPSLIGGYFGNAVTAGVSGGTIAGGGMSGYTNTITDDFGVVGGGYRNQAGDADGYLFNKGGATVGGGIFNTASGYGSTVAGGYVNAASGYSSTVAGGTSNTAGGYASTVAGGYSNEANGNYGFAAGFQAKATQTGSFVWGDSAGGGNPITSPAPNTFSVRAAGGIWLGTTSFPSIQAGRFVDTSTGAYLSTAGAWTNNSDRAKKHDFRPLDPRSIVQKVARMPIQSWSYKVERRAVRHVGPTAQDFFEAFGLGLDDKHITTIDEGGVALAAIKGLYRQNQRLEHENQALQRANAAQDARLTRLEGMLRAQP
jgi:hypothetical protein